MFLHAAPASTFALLLTLTTAAFNASALDDVTLDRIEAQLDTEFAAGDPPVPNGINDVHGLVRTGTVSGDFSGLPDQTGDGPEFGHSVAMQGDWLVVGAPGTRWDQGSLDVDAYGVVFVFRRVGGQWVQQQRIQRHIGPGAARCGHAVALNMPHLAFGCPHRESSDGFVTGRVEVFLFDEAKQQFEPSEQYTANAHDRCGTAVALSRNYLVHGCPTSSEEEYGRISVRKRDPLTNQFTHWEGNLSAPNETPGMNFGTSVALYEPSEFDPTARNVRVAVGAPNAIYDGSIFPRGSVYVYHRALDSDTWSRNSTFRPAPVDSDDASLASFGLALAMNRTQLVIGAPNNRYGGIQTLPGPGSVHRYSFANIVGWQAQETGGGTNVQDGPHAGMRFGAAIALGWNNFTAIGAPGTDGDHDAGGTAEAVGLLEVRRTGSDDWSVFNYHGDLRPGPLNVLSRENGHFGQSIDADVVNRRMAVGYPHSGTTLLPTARGSVWIYESDSIFENGFD